jgi:integrase
MRGPFQITKRTYKGISSFYARFQNPDGSIIKEVKLEKARSRTAAALEAKKLLDLGILPSADDPFIIDFVKDFWSDDSLYVRYRARHGLNMSKRYIEDSRNAVLTRFGKILKDKRLSDLSPLLVEKGIDALDRSGLGPRSINIALQALKVPVSWHSKMHRIPNPLQYVLKVKETTRECSALSPLEVSRLLQIEDETLRAKGAILLGALCGLRLGEIRGLQWSDVDFERRLINVNHNLPTGSKDVKQPKWGSARTVPLPLALAEILKKIPDMPDHSPLFVIYNQAHTDAPVDITTIHRALERMLKKAGVDAKVKRARHLSIHSLRHTFITLSRLGGLPDFLVQRLAGHKSAQMMERYSHAKNIIDYDAALSKFQKVLDDAEEGDVDSRREKKA